LKACEQNSYPSVLCVLGGSLMLTTEDTEDTEERHERPLHAGMD
jgi:hypothetical protein